MFLPYGLSISLVLFLVAFVLSVSSLFSQKDIYQRMSTGLALLGFLCIFAMILQRTIVSQRVPLSNMFEFGMFFLWSAIAVYLFIYFKYKIKYIGIVILPMASLMTLWLLSLDKTIKPVMPVLKSNWLYFHVSTAIAGYGCFTVSFAIALLYLIKSGSNSSLSKGLPSLELLDELTYKIICIGMIFLTMCIVTGAFWAENAWGKYWTWDPKETWSLITWLIYASFLHVRLVSKWQGKKAIYLAIVGFLAVVFTFWGVNLLLPGLHSYK